MLQRTSTLSSPATDLHARDDNIASCTPAPTTDSGIVSHSLDHVNCDSPLSSIERHEGTTAAERSTSRVIEKPTAAIAVELAGLQLRDSTATPLSREDSLLPGLFDKLQLRDSTPLTPSRGGSLSLRHPAQAAAVPRVVPKDRAMRSVTKCRPRHSITHTSKVLSKAPRPLQAT